jgi:hypothetical protein
MVCFDLLPLRFGQNLPPLAGAAISEKRRSWVWAAGVVAFRGFLF